jgi:hypothetical protein
MKAGNGTVGNLIFTVFLMALGGVLYAQEKEAFFAGPLAEASFYSRKAAAWGGGFILGYGDNPAALGLMAVYSVDGERITTLETTLFLRVYLLPGRRGSLFVQLNGGPALFNLDGVSVPAESGTISAGVAAGWRFLAGRHWYVDGVIRAGWPFFAGAGISAGFRF